MSLRSNVARYIARLELKFEEHRTGQRDPHASLRIGVREIVVCAGARNAPFVKILSGESPFKVYSFFEERSAGFFLRSAVCRIQQGPWRSSQRAGRRRLNSYRPVSRPSTKGCLCL